MKTKKNDNDEFISPFVYALSSKPLKVYETLYLELLPLGQKINIPRHSTYHISKEKDGMGVLLLTNGLLSVCQLSSDTFIQSLFPPSVVGFVDNYRYYYDVPETMSVCYHAETDVTAFFVPLEVFINLIDTKNLWHDVSRILAHRLLIMSSKFNSRANSNAYHMIRDLIMELWDYPSEYREQITLPIFIQRRTGLSRSRIMKLLFDLKIGGYIHIENGKLTSVEKLPDNY